MDGRRWPQSPSISQLTSPLETIPSCYRRSRHTKFQPHSRRHLCQPWNALQFLSPKRVLRFADPTKTAFSKSVGWVPKHCLEKPQIFISHRSQKSLINPLNRFTFSAGVEYYALIYKLGQN